MFGLEFLSENGEFQNPVELLVLNRMQDKASGQTCTKNGELAELNIEETHQLIVSALQILIVFALHIGRLDVIIESL